ncbi:family 10 glycosylhydrolase [Pseudanabaena sp. SR411]|uniref:family 10 glycosylhydrolase n=1 Tax=Pseudanabaena sp. SR411 TaxID=1980935 RepID=UPI0020CC1EFA|nr:glycoside hydrolase family 10 protein [Pseudanabaena sp. SR411]
MPQNWQENNFRHNLRHSFRQMLRSRKRFLSFLFVVTFATTILLHSLIPAFLLNDQAIAQIQPQISQLNQPIIPPSPPINQPVDKRQEIRGVWLTSNDFSVLRDRQQLSEALKQLKQLNFNTIYPVVWNSGYVMYPSAVAQEAGIQPFVYRGSEGQDIVEDIIAQGHQNNLLVMPWYEFGFMAPQMSELAIAHPDWLTQQRNGDKTSITAAGEVAWLNPFHPEVQQFLTDLILEAVSKYDLDGIQFDDHTSLPKTFGYDRYTLNLYRQETKKEAPTDVNNPDWVRWRANKITAFMARLSKAVKQRKPNVIFSVSPNYHDFAYRQQLQDWLSWVRQGFVDELLVQVYRDDLDDFLSQISRPEIVEVQGKISTAIAILSGLRNSNVPMSRVYSQAVNARNRGLGVSFFYYKSLWGYGPESVADRQRDFQYLFRSPAPRFANRN